MIIEYLLLGEIFISPVKPATTATIPTAIKIREKNITRDSRYQSQNPSMLSIAPHSLAGLPKKKIAKNPESRSAETVRLAISEVSF